MKEYEIRITPRGADNPRVYRCTELGDQAAIKQARQNAGEGDLIEVWRGMQCIFLRRNQGPAGGV